MNNDFKYLPTDIYLFGVEYPTVDGKKVPPMSM